MLEGVFLGNSSRCSRRSRWWCAGAAKQPGRASLSAASRVAPRGAVGTFRHLAPVPRLGSFGGAESRLVLVNVFTVEKVLHFHSMRRYGLPANPLSDLLANPFPGHRVGLPIRIIDRYCDLFKKPHLSHPHVFSWATSPFTLAPMSVLYCFPETSIRSRSR